ncbi:cysteine hydrolase family protein [Chitinophaga flava]|nr:cysteine hydrolase family protein [Chitinophaga flava]
MNKRHGWWPMLALLSLLLSGSISANASHKKKNMEKKALIIIDVQNDYFKGGKMELYRPDAAADNIKRILEKCRKEGIPVVYIQHAAADGFLVANTTGAEIHPSVLPLPGEKIITKHYPNSFRETALLDYLKQIGVSNLIITGMMTHVCVDATTRAAKDLGFHCTVVADACATRELEVDAEKVPAVDVQRALIGSLGFYYADIVNTQQYLKQ